MFDLFRSREKSVRVLLGVLLGLVAVSMLVYLIPGGPGSGMGTGTDTVATVGDYHVTTQDVQRAIQRVTRSQANLPKGLLAMYIPSMVNQLVEGKAMAYKARELGLRISDEELGNAIQEEFAGALGGKFDMSMYQMVLQQQGMTVPDYEKDRREELLALRLAALEGQALVISDQAAKAEYQRKNLKIGLDYIDFDPKNFAAKVNKDPASLKAYFDKNRVMFRTPEKRNVELILGTTADFMPQANISEQQARKEYQDSIDSYRIPERVKVRHILIKMQGKPKEEVPKLKAKAEDLLKQLRHGGNFAELAKKNSEDPGSAEKGGELDWIGRGQTVANFEKAAFTLQPNQLSDLVETEYGYHIIQVEEKQTAHTQSFEDVKGQIMADLQKQAATDHLSRAIESAHSETAKTPGQAEAAAKKYGLKFFKVDNYVPGSPLPELNAESALTSTITSAQKGGVTEVSSIQAQGKAAFVVVTNIVAPRDSQYAEAQGDVIQKYTATESSRLAQEAAKSALERARKGENLQAIAKGYGLTVKSAAPFSIDGAAEGIGSATLLESAFKANVGDTVGPIAAQGGEFICKVTTKAPADMNQYAANRDSIVQGLQTQKQTIQEPLFRDSVVSELKRRGKIKLNQDAINRMVGTYQS